MKSKFVKSTLVAGLAIVAIDANASNVVIGCAANSNNTTGATVYSIDSTASNGTAQTLNANVGLGFACSRAVNAMLASYSLVGVNNQTIKNAGYSLQVFTFDNTQSTTSAASTAPYLLAQTSSSTVVGMVGCAAPSNGTSGATVYSVDALSSTGSALDSSTNARLGAACSNGLSAATAAAGIGNSSTALRVIPVNVTIDNAGYSLNQYIVAQ